MKRYIAIVVVVLAFCSAQFGQVEDEPKHLPSAALSKIVDVVLRAEFKPRKEPTVIYIYGNALRGVSLPEIANINFILINDAELEGLGKAYLFKDPVVDEGKVRIDVGYGDTCNASGGSYFFRIRDDRVTRTKDAGGWGSGCCGGSGSSFAVLL